MFLLLILIGCGTGAIDDTGESGTTTPETCLPSINQGVYGQVLWREGDHSPGTGASSGTERPVETTVASWYPLADSDLVPADADDPEVYGHYDVLVQPYSHTRSDADGCYELGWSPGSLTILAADEDAWYCNNFDDRGACVVDILSTTLTRFDIVIDYAASY